MKKAIGITMGDPKGIGPEIVAKAWRSMSEEERSQLLIYGDHAALSAAAELCSTAFDARRVVTTSSTSPPIQKVDDAEAARLAISAIDAAVADAESGRIAAIVTAPVNKMRMRSAVPNFFGHTEYLADAAGVKDAVMMFASPDYIAPGTGVALPKQLCVSLVTMHKAIRDVPSSVTTEKVLTSIRQTALALETHFACPDARIAVMALNPHAGEGGSLGDEEKSAIAPAIARALKEGINCIGPLPADSLFRKLSDFDYDAVIAMYHDQGILPVKLLFQSGSVNVTLGLPYIRTSPSHGTAEDLAWLGTADESGMTAAISLTRKLVGWQI
ncbi:MAG TPA: 4-hydroxythreonine-4-phosphate dehydrogenase PdxA [bacterium]|nr:4-hydroxythreonine-4-phosphate dehydrogenase PdxA [bacterium]